MSVTQLLRDLPVLLQIAKPTKQSSFLSERLNNRYQFQASKYDDFRSRLLHGREELLDSLIPNDFSGTWIDIGGGTGWNIEYAHTKLNKNANVILIDLCEPLLEIARNRFCKLNAPSVKVINGNACDFSLDFKANLITFSYSLSMIPNWFQAIENAKNHLLPQGKIGVVDFYKPRKNDSLLKDPKLNSWINRKFIPWWFSHDDVYLNDDFIPFLQTKFVQHEQWVSQNPIPYFPLKVSNFGFIGLEKQ